MGGAAVQQLFEFGAIRSGIYLKYVHWTRSVYTRCLPPIAELKLSKLLLQPVHIHPELCLKVIVVILVMDALDVTHQSLLESAAEGTDYSIVCYVGPWDLDASEAEVLSLVITPSVHFLKFIDVLRNGYEIA